MTTPDIKLRVTRAVAKILGHKPETINATETLDSLGADSLHHVEIAMDIETEFDILIEDSESSAIVTVQDLIDLVTRKLAA